MKIQAISLLIMIILSLSMLSGCESVPHYSESYFTLSGILYDYDESSFILYRSDMNSNYTYLYGDKLTYDIARTLTKGETYHFNYYTYKLSNHQDASIHTVLLEIQNAENAIVWKKA